MVEYSENSPHEITVLPFISILSKSIKNNGFKLPQNWAILNKNVDEKFIRIFKNRNLATLHGRNFVSNLNKTSTMSMFWSRNEIISVQYLQKWFILKGEG